MSDGAQTLHATTVAIDARGIVIMGPSGSGKSALALQLMALGARLVADDRTILTPRDGALFATAPAPLLGLIEARGVGLLRADPLAEAEVALVIDLSRQETDRLPPQREIILLDRRLPLLQNVASAHFPAAIRQYVLSGRSA